MTAAFHPSQSYGSMPSDRSRDFMFPWSSLTADDDDEEESLIIFLSAETDPDFFICCILKQPAH